MRLRLIAFTDRGMRLGETLVRALAAEGEDARLAAGFRPHNAAPLHDWTREAFSQADGLVFIGAAGIAVRAIAPFVRDKQTDPAVVVLDELGRYAVSLLSGHAGGANRLAGRLAGYVGAMPVLTTATDGRGAFAVDVWAKRHGLVLLEREAAKAVSAALLRGGAVGVVSAFAIEGRLPEGLTEGECARVGLAIGIDARPSPFETTLHVLPKILTLGIGCRRGTAVETLEARVEHALESIGARRESVLRVASIDRKADEEGLLALCERHAWPLQTHTAQALSAVPGVFTASDRVLGAVGVDNVCERAAAMYGKSVLRKQAGQGVTVAIAQAPFAVTFKEERT